MKIAIYPGSFDPLHNGHLNIIQKASELFDILYVVISNNSNKIHKNNINDRYNNAKKIIKNTSNIKVIINNNNLTVDLAHKLNAKYIVRGLRDTEDLNYEIEYFDGFKSLDKNIELVYFISDIEKRKLSSKIINEIEKIKNK